MAKALLENNIVVDISDTEFDVHSALTWADCGDDVQVGWEYDGTNFSDPNAPTAEEQLEELRGARNWLLKQTDYLALSDNTLSTEMATYRQALRDITNTYSSVDTVVWPTKPQG